MVDIYITSKFRVEDPPTSGKLGSVSDRHLVTLELICCILLFDGFEKKAFKSLNR